LIKAIGLLKVSAFMLLKHELNPCAKQGYRRIVNFWVGKGGVSEPLNEKDENYLQPNSSVVIREYELNLW
jgi:hypothetical protein